MRPDVTACAHCPTRLACITSQMGAGDLAAVEPEIRRRRAQRGEQLAMEGEVAHSVQVIRAGMAFTFHRGVDGRTRTVAIARPGTPLGVYGVFGQATPFSAAAASHAGICTIPVRALAAVAARNTDYSRHLASTAMEMCARIASWSGAARIRGVANQLAYALLLLTESDSSQAVDLPTHVALGELLGATRETVARGLSELEQEGAIRRANRRQCELRRDALAVRLQKPARGERRAPA